MNTTTYTEAVAELAAIAGNNAARYFRTDIAADAKHDGSPVTIADRSSERLVREWIERKFPSDGIVGEEYGVLNPNAKRRWVVDPIDGTKAFIKGVPFWGSLVAVTEGDEVVAGAASFPALSEQLVAGRGEGCWWNGARCTVSITSRIADSTVLTTDIGFRGDENRRRGWLDLAGMASISRTWGDCVGYLLVATGRAEVMTDPIIAEWDIAALVPAIVEAGGVFSEWERAGSTLGKSAIATNSALSQEARAVLNRYLP